MFKLLFLFLFFGKIIGLPLDDYINKPDKHYNYMNTNITFEGLLWKAEILNMTSQQWLTDSDSDRSIWWHYVVVITPYKVIDKNTSILYITGGSNNNDYLPDEKNEEIILGSKIAVLSNTITTILFQIPNQPIVFPSDKLKQSRTEDAIVAFTWDHFLRNNNDTEWILRLPMTKAAVKCMDTIQDFKNVNKFIVAGASKRGWTTYFTAAVDNRVIGMIPMVMDMLNLIKSIHHMYRSYGGWTWAFHDYYEMDILSRIDTPEMKLLAQIDDPLVYIDRLNMPKLVVNSGNDEFFMIDDILFWWNKLKEPKNWLLLPNTEHSMITGIHEVIPAVSAWIKNLVEKNSIPTINWNITDNGTIIMKTDTQPSEVSVWYATTADNKRRDFRIANLDNPCYCGFEAKKHCINLKVLWNKIELPTVKDISYRLSPPEDKWIAFFIDVKFNYLEFTTGASILPKYYPYPDCIGIDCRSHLL